MEIRLIYFIISFWLGLALTTLAYWIFLQINLKLAIKTAKIAYSYLQSIQKIQEFGKTLNENSSDEDLLIGILGIQCLNKLLDKTNILAKQLDKLNNRCDNTFNAINFFLKILTFGKLKLAYYDIRTGEIFDN